MTIGPSAHSVLAYSKQGVWYPAVGVFWKMYPTHLSDRVARYGQIRPRQFSNCKECLSIKRSIMLERMHTGT